MDDTSHRFTDWPLLQPRFWLLRHCSSRLDAVYVAVDSANDLVPSMCSVRSFRNAAGSALVNLMVSQPFDWDSVL